MDADEREQTGKPGEDGQQQSEEARLGALLLDAEVERARRAERDFRIDRGYGVAHFLFP